MTQNFAFMPKPPIKHFLLFAILVLCLGGWESDFAKKPNLNKSSQGQPTPFEITEADKLFIELRDAARRNDVPKTQQLSAQLSNYPDTDYVRYFRIKPQMFDKGNEARADSSVDEEVGAFLKTYDGAAIGDRMRNDWLLVLGKPIQTGVDQS